LQDSLGGDRGGSVGGLSILFYTILRFSLPKKKKKKKN
jgi:hypothetical protein